MRFFLVFLASVIPVASAAFEGSNAIAEAKKALENWQPKSVTLSSEGALRVVLPQRRITREIYEASVLAGICAKGVMGFKYKFSGVRSIEIVNEFDRQGWVFDDGVGACEEVLEAPISKPNVPLLSRTHLL